MIRLTGVTVRYGRRTVLDEADFHLPEGGVAYVTGRSGAGKSTLIKLITRETSAVGGEVRVAGRPLDEWKKHHLRRRIGILFQAYELLERKTVRENIALAAQVRGLYGADTERHMRRLLARVGLEGREREYPGELSGGEQQRVAVVRALMGQPKLVLADEPTGNLDGETAGEVMGLLHELQREEGLTMLIVSHDRELMARFPAACWEVADGKVRSG
ncbi:cell division ATP-binding protein FtsE [Cohnella cellulosilytica]|uniref:Cell division ATP-binding protein FtsE n=1 Tax=Cohnella cellulosilytica TaxID=986710 RepID=A0ABW2FDC7_9BACL